MKVLENVDLSTMTSIKIGGTAKLLIVPESEQELLNAVNIYTTKMYIGGVKLINKQSFLR